MHPHAPAGSGGKRRKPPEERRREILAAAARVFSRHGYRLTDVQDIADQADVGKGTVYRFFGSKEELFLATVEARIEGLREDLNEAVAPWEDPLEKLRVGVRRYLRYFDEHPHTVELFIQERAEFPERSKPLYFLYEEADRAGWVALYDELARAGRIRAIPADRAFRVLADLLYGTILSHHLSAREDRLEERADEVFDIFLHGITARKGTDEHADP